MEIAIGNKMSNDGLYIVANTLESKKSIIKLAESSSIDFPNDINGFLKQLNHEILHEVVARIINFQVSFMIDTLRIRFPFRSYEFLEEV